MFVALLLGLGAAAVAAVGLGITGRYGWGGVLAGPVVGVALVAVAQELSNESLNGGGGDITPRSLTTLVGIAVIVLSLAGYAVGTAARLARRR
ncbi:MAG TPA: hypothetical protein VHI30_13685 [Gaiellales bacterium]|jgi:hypothetical protein|nr:hypothetical protein [Gaiellales bacterium]